MPMDSQEIWSTYIVPWTTNVGLAIIVFLVGKWIVKLVSRALSAAMTKARLDPMLVAFLGNIINAILMLVVVVAALSQLGIETTSLVALLGAAGIAVGLALKDSLAHFAAGVMIILFRPFKTGDYVEVAGTGGTVMKITVFSTELKTPDARQVIVPNGSIFGSNVVNYSAMDTRRIDLVVGIAYDADMKKAKDVIMNVVKSHPNVLPEPEPLVAVSELADSSVNLVVRPWVKTPDLWPTRFALIEQIKEALDANDITIPFPQMDVHFDRPAA
ncbi:mechanosensitive ion channel [Salinispirillum sp. LH 10-3-1]|uniref:Small-conductance mechanosensitive channel n=1 Tax=Salinispirillum sp. LH 10-3-1 TaxID=2952525 RepID=A0AB38YCP6_9GAMM